MLNGELQWILECNRVLERKLALFRRLFRKQLINVTCITDNFTELQAMLQN